MKHVIAIDIGTTGTRAIVFDREAREVASSYTQYETRSPKPAWAEQDPREILDATVEMIRCVMEKTGLKPDDIAGVGISSVLLSLMAVDGGGRPLTPLSIWADNRGIDEVERLRRENDAHAIYMRTGCQLHPMYPLSRILWFRRNDPELFRKAHKFISVKAFLIHTLFGKYLVDTSLGSATGFLNLSERDWDEELLGIMGIGRRKLSKVVDGLTIVTGLDPGWAKKMRLSPDTPFVMGAGDGMLSNLGVGALGGDRLVSTVGTTAAVRLTKNKRILDEEERLWCYALFGDYWITGGALNNGAVVLKWFGETIGRNLAQETEGKGSGAFSELYDPLAAGVPPGADGLIVLPFLTGERSPNWNARAKGVFLGLRLNHGAGHIVRALMEGVTFRLYAVYEALMEFASGNPEIIICGGYARSEVWPQIQADVFGQRVLVPSVTESSARGAALAAMKALGLLREFSEIDTPIEKRFEPDEKRHKLYEEIFEVSLEGYDRLVPIFEEIDDL